MDDPYSPSPILPPPSPPPFGSGGSSPTGSMTQQEISEGKALAAVGYVIWIVALIVLILRNNAFSLYHSKQAMAMTIVHFVISLPLACVFFGVAIAMSPPRPPHGGVQAAPPPAFICGFLGIWGIIMLLSLWSVAMIIVGLVNSIGGKTRPLPLYGYVADKLFTGIKKQQL